VSHPNVVISSLKPSRDRGIALRVYEASGRPTQGVTIKLNAKVGAAREANLLEDPGAALKVDAGSLHIDLKPFEIKTIWIDWLEQLIKD
jgi:alpha-mannosidase